MKKIFFVSALLSVSMAMASNTEPATPNAAPLTSAFSINSVSPFCVAIAKGDFDTVKKLVELGADINAKSNGMTPLMYAAKFNRCEILKYLIDQGAAVKTKDSRLGYTAMDFAKISNAEQAIKILEEASKS